MENNGYRLCAVIPVYNHGSTAGAVVQALAAEGIPSILVDDGSDEATKAHLAKITAEDPSAILHTLPQNLGKGGAVTHGLLKAFEAGFTHALQVDADGQHDLGSIRTFRAVSEKNPTYLVAGRPVYDDSVPTGRKIGRVITNFWIAIETISRDIPDGMCGFRLYPLEPCHRLLTRTKVGPRMDFDIDVIVRLHWMGVPMVFEPVRVVYPEGGLSHFRMFRDNVSISRIHTILFFGMVWRLPVLLARKFRPKPRKV